MAKRSALPRAAYALFVGWALISACATTEPPLLPAPQGTDQASVLPASRALPPGKLGARPTKPGYFVVLANSKSAPDAATIYRVLYNAVDQYNRVHANPPEARQRYLDAFAADGNTRLADDASEIECDPEKCLLKLVAKSLASPPGSASGSLPEKLTEAFGLAGIKPRTIGRGRTLRKSYAVGRRSGLRIACVKSGLPSRLGYQCDFVLDGIDTGRRGATAVIMPARDRRGRLVNCELAPGVTRAADEAKAQMDGAELLKLGSGAGDGAPAVGFLRLVRQPQAVEFLDVFLCGDLSHDFFRIEGLTRRPNAWLPHRARVGAILRNLDGLIQDEARLEASTLVVAESAGAYVLEVKFKVARASDVDLEVYGEDRFFIKLDKSWLR